MRSRGTTLELARSEGPANDLPDAGTGSSWRPVPAGSRSWSTGLVDRLSRDTAEAPARGRLTQGPAAVPGATASRALVELSHDEDSAVVLTAAYLLQPRDAR
ncbi:hypothetical protein GCM10010446_36480 [Streptomyces enissocaesilis]|uniref:Uncharacterized protein n=1 Tax=Streptomyces enissocaesilis TaxID=332589 RepID=A0ABN3XEG2_9ACTN